MDRLLARLERRLGRYAVPNLIVYVVAGMAIVWFLTQLRPGTSDRLELTLAGLQRGELWRLFTFLLIPTASGSSMFVFLGLYFTWWVGTTLEQHWGSFRFDLYYLVGALGAIAAALVAGAATNTWIDLSLLLAFATLFPDVSILLFFVLPIRVKWLGVVGAGLMILALVKGDWQDRAGILASMANYILFFGGHWVGVFRERNLAVRQAARREDLRAAAPVFGQRVCAVCGAREANGADIRVCSCEKCGSKPRALCLEHARNH